MSTMTCRSCGAPLRHTFVDLGVSPISNNFLKPEDLNKPEPFFPLHVFVCNQCWLVQLPEVQNPEQIFTSTYVYFSSFSDSWVEHARNYVEMIIPRLELNFDSLVIELASNDGYLLQHFIPRRIPVLGIEPCANVAEAAMRKGVPTLVQFFGTKMAGELAEQGKKADLVIGNNVLAHVPALNDFVGGMKLVLKPRGVITMEFPHLMRLMAENQFDTIYHEHFSYFSLIAVEKVFARHGLTLFDVEEIPTHGGSLRIYARHAEDAARPVGPRVQDLRAREEAAGLNRLEPYGAFAEKVKETKRGLLAFLIAAKKEGKKVAAYGAAAKGNTLLNYCGVRDDFIDYVADRSPHKQGAYLPGTRIPVVPPDRIKETRPDYLLILPWNIQDEVMQQMAHIRNWGGQFVTPIPRVEVHP